jgi:hypothetical protein
MPVSLVPKSLLKRRWQDRNSGCQVLRKNVPRIEFIFRRKDREAFVISEDLLILELGHWRGKKKRPVGRLEKTFKTAGLPCRLDFKE